LALKKQETCRQAPVAGCLAGPTPTRFHPSSTNLDNQTVDQQSHGKFTSCPQFDLARHGRLIYRARMHGCNCVWHQRTLPHCARCFTCFTEYLTRLPLLVVPRPSWGISGSGPRVLFWRCNARIMCSAHAAWHAVVGPAHGLRWPEEKSRCPSYVIIRYVYSFTACGPKRYQAHMAVAGLLFGGRSGLSERCGPISAPSSLL
jgi:hypothetical protein